MNTITRIIASLSLLLAAAACQQFVIDTQMTPEKEYANLRMVCDAVDAYHFASTNADNITFNVSANTPWTITRSSGAEWCTVTPSSSASSSLISDVVVSVANNTAGEDRSATLTLTGERINKTYTITITQDRKGKLFVTPVAKDYAATGGPLSFTINTNLPWEVRSNVSWLSFNRESGQPDPDGRTITIIATAEPSEVMERVATVTVVAGDDEETFDVTQKGSFDMTAITGEFPGKGGSQQLKLRTDLPWTVSADKDWISFDKESGAGSNGVTAITVTAAPNDDTVRKAVITVRCGGEDHSFEVRQAGASFAIVPPADPTVDRKGGEIVVAVEASKSWEPKSETPGVTVAKVDDSHFKVTVGWNDTFAPRKCVVSIVSPSGATDSIELTQDINFSFEGHYEILTDGSVKIYCDQKTKVITLDSFRFATVTLTMGEVNFTDKGELWVTTKGDGDTNIYNQLTLGGNTRLRTDGTMAIAGKSTYNNQKYSITKDEMNALKTYRFEVLPEKDNIEDLLDDGTVVPHHVMNFFYNDEKSPRATMSSRSGIADDPSVSNPYRIGVEETTSASWYVIKTCKVVPVEE